MGKKKKEKNQKTGNEAQIQSSSTAEQREAAAISSPQSELKAKIESILFCIPEGVTADLLAHKVSMASADSVKWALEELRKDYEIKAGGLKIVSDDKGVWKFKVPDEHIPFVQEAAVPEFDRAVLETLAYIAWRNGSRQCDVVRVRGNKAYNHIRLLKERGFIESHRSGLSKWLELTKKFSEYFNLKQGEKLPVPEEVAKAAEEAEKAAAAAALQEQELKAQQAQSIADLKKARDEEKFKKELESDSDENEPDDDEIDKPNGEKDSDDEQDNSNEDSDDSDDEVPGEPEDDETELENPDNE